MRMNLLDSVAHLKIAHDTAVVCIAASKQTNADCNEEVASVLFNMVNHQIDEQMRVISSIVRQLGVRCFQMAWVNHRPRKRNDASGNPFRMGSLFPILRVLTSEPFEPSRHVCNALV